MASRSMACASRLLARATRCEQDTLRCSLLLNLRPTGDRPSGPVGAPVVRATAYNVASGTRPSVTYPLHRTFSVRDPGGHVAHDRRVDASPLAALSALAPPSARKAVFDGGRHGGGGGAGERAGRHVDHGRCGAHDPRPPTATPAQWLPSPPFDVIETFVSLSRVLRSARRIRPDGALRLVA